MKGSPARPRRHVILLTMGLGIQGGIAQLTASIVDALATAVDAGLMDGVTVVSYLDDALPPLPDSFEVLAAGGSRRRLLVNQVRALARHPQTPVITDHALLGRLLAHLPRLIRPTYAVVAHGNELDAEERLPIHTALNRAALIIAVSETSKRKVKQLIGSTNGPSIAVMPPGVSAAKVREWDSIIAQRGKPIVLIAGRMKASDPGKGHDALLRSWPEVVRRHPDAHLIVAGEGDLRPDLERLASQLGVATSVRFVGHVSLHELGVLFRGAQVFAMPSRQEGFGLVYAEAMYAGLPCIGSTADAAVDVITDGVDGRLVPFGDSVTLAGAICDLLSSPALRSEMGRAARRKYERCFAPEAFYERFISTISILT